MVVELEEAPAREFFVEPGYGSYEGLRIGIGARERNLFGSGRTLDFEATVAERDREQIGRALHAV